MAANLHIPISFLLETWWRQNGSTVCLGVRLGLYEDECTLSVDNYAVVV